MLHVCCVARQQLPINGPKLDCLITRWRCAVGEHLELWRPSMQFPFLGKVLKFSQMLPHSVETKWTPRDMSTFWVHRERNNKAEFGWKRQNNAVVHCTRNEGTRAPTVSQPVTMLGSRCCDAKVSIHQSDINSAWGLSCADLLPGISRAVSVGGTDTRLREMEDSGSLKHLVMDLAERIEHKSRSSVMLGTRITRHIVLCLSFITGYPFHFRFHWSRKLSPPLYWRSRIGITNTCRSLTNRCNFTHPLFCSQMSGPQCACIDPQECNLLSLQTDGHLVVT